MNLKFNKIVVICILTICFFITLFPYKNLPEEIVTHWDISGEPNGSMPKILGAMIIPLILLGLDVLLFALPNIDPLKKNVLKFKPFYEGFIILFSIFLLLIQMHLILWNLGIQINPSFLISFLLPILFFYIGILCEKSKRNWFIGIRNPWTLSSDFVWEKTHKIGAKLFKVSAAISLLGIIFKKLAIYFILIPLIFIFVYTFIYSYYVYSKKTKNKKK